MRAKRFLAALITMLLPLVASAEAVEINGIYYNLISKSKSAEVTQNPNRYSGDIIIPASVEYEGNTYTVEYVGNGAFASCKDLTSLTIPSGVVSIGESACWGCTSLLSVVIPNSVQSIGWGAFGWCGLTSVTIPPDITSIEENTFQNCESLTSVVIPDKVTTIANYAFYGCKGMTSVTVGKSVNSIRGAFAKCTELTNFYCYAQGMPDTSTRAFEDSFIDHATLYVPIALIDFYTNQDPWKNFKTIIGVKKCAKPVINVDGGKLSFSCETERVDFVYDIINLDAKTGSGKEVELTNSYTITVYASKDGYENSDIATADVQVKSVLKKADVNEDGVVNAEDIVETVNIIMSENSK